MAFLGGAECAGAFCAGAFRFPLGERAYIMGILNVTPDSFSDGGRYSERDAALRHAEDMERAGADILDIGAQSTRPGHAPVTAEEEWERLEPVLRGLREQTALPLSVDTYYPAVAAAAVEAGAAIINDVSGSLENGMPRVAAGTGAGLVMMHAGGGADDTGEGDAVEAVRLYFRRAMAAAAAAGLPPERVCLDPGIGFGKDRHGDLALAARLGELTAAFPETAFLVGASRKRVIAACCSPEPPVGGRLAGTLAFHTVARWNGAHILRVHDVAQAVQAARVTDALRRAAGK
ncbi:MAG TPA: dihydropteroate synthase [Firmicutes bacterium]|nr:dihydropteroate synthase [Bacillota bacterium]